jgi:hypothetical protein
LNGRISTRYKTGLLRGGIMECKANLGELFERIIKRDMMAIDEIETLEDAKEIITKMCLFYDVLRTMWQ